MVRSLALGLAIAATAASAAAAASRDPTGTWLTEDGRARIRMEKCGPSNDRLCGYVVWLKVPSNADGSPKLDAKNPEPGKRSRQALGIQLLQGLKPNADGRYEGQIYNADDGKSYDVSIWSEEPGELSVRGCLVAFLCKTQTWAKASDLVPGQMAAATGAPGGPRPEPAFRAAQVTGSVGGKPAARKPVPAAAQPAPAAEGE